MSTSAVTPTAASALLGELARTMVVRASVSEILDAFVVALVDLLPVTGAGVSVTTEPGSPPQIAASDEIAQSIEALQTRLHQGPCVVACETGARCLVADLSRESRFPDFVTEAQAAGLGAAFAFPLRYGGQCLGAVDLYRDTPGGLTPDEITAASAIAHGVCALVLNAQRRCQLESLIERLGVAARRDPLTEVANRNALTERLELAIKRWERSRRPFTVLFIDLDGFKSINDRHGHVHGDQVLSAFASRLSAAVRPADLVARLGGDEFAVVCEDLDDPRGPDEILARIRQELAVPFTIGETTIRLRASIGSATPGPGQVTPRSLLHAGDQAMYCDKRARAPSSG